MTNTSTCILEGVYCKTGRREGGGAGAGSFDLIQYSYNSINWMIIGEFFVLIDESITLSKQFFSNDHLTIPLNGSHSSGKEWKDFLPLSKPSQKRKLAEEIRTPLEFKKGW
jgi:hypothetical protein